MVRPLPKISSPETLKDLRPISLLSFTSKILEKVCDIQIKVFVRQHNILPPFQSGFRPHYSTSTALTDISDDILQAFDKKQVTAIVLLDYSKAFDLLNHDILLHKLSLFYFLNSAIAFVRSYLSNRSQQTFIEQ